MGSYSYNDTRHMNRILMNEQHLIYYNETVVDACWDPYQGKYSTSIYTYISEMRFLWFKIRRIHQSIPYINMPTLDGEYKTNVILKEAARKEYYKAVLVLNENKKLLKLEDKIEEENHE